MNSVLKDDAKTKKRGPLAPRLGFLLLESVTLLRGGKKGL